MKQLPMKPTDTRHLFFAAVGVLAISLSDQVRFPSVLFDQQKAVRVERILPSVDRAASRLTCETPALSAAGQTSRTCEEPKERNASGATISRN